jgi:uncharacterized BrkB/YihY/UPF0761 family membrane protein
MTFDSTVLVFLLGLIATLIGVSYQKPEVHRDIISPTIGRLFLPSIVVGVIATISSTLIYSQLKPLLNPTKLAEAQKIADAYVWYGSMIWAIGMLLMLFDFALMYVAMKAREHARDRQS